MHVLTPLEPGKAIDFQAINVTPHQISIMFLHDIKPGPLASTSDEVNNKAAIEEHHLAPLTV